MLRHVETRWLSIAKVLIRIFEQWENLKQYFNITVCKDRAYKIITKDERFNRIKKVLNNNSSKIYMSFVVYTASHFSKFIVPLQSASPMIHNLYNMCMDLFRCVFKTLMLPTTILKGSKLRTYAELRKSNLSDPKLQSVNLNTLFLLKDP